MSQAHFLITQLDVHLDSSCDTAIMMALRPYVPDSDYIRDFTIDLGKTH
jgi:hypothetical protein